MGPGISLKVATFEVGDPQVAAIDVGSTWCLENQSS
jgi:hypothetical protein